MKLVWKTTKFFINLARFYDKIKTLKIHNVTYPRTEPDWDLGNFRLFSYYFRFKEMKLKTEDQSEVIK